MKSDAPTPSGVLAELDRQTLRRQLETLKQRTLDELCRRTEPLNTLQERESYEHEVHDNADDAELERSEDLRFAEIDADRQRLKDIEQALRRMDEGRYGVCVDCAEGIPRERLMAYPTALRCGACQLASEKRRHA
jgi:RNA polymerase-binding protein DksA